MKYRIIVVLVISMVLALGLAGVAQAQSFCDLMAFSAGSGQPGGTVVVAGEAFQGDDITVTFDGTVVGSAVADEYDEFAVSFMIPADAAVGNHEVSVEISGEGTEVCPFDFAVEAATAPAVTVPAALPATLPSTGFMLLPAGGLIVSGIGALLVRKRRR